MRSDIVSIVNSCGTVLASSAGDRESSDTLTGFDLVDRRPVAVSDALAFSGTITALWPAGNGAAVITRNSATGNYAAYKVSVRCSQ